MIAIPADDYYAMLYKCSWYIKKLGCGMNVKRKEIWYILFAQPRVASVFGFCVISEFCFKKIEFPSMYTQLLQTWTHTTYITLELLLLFDCCVLYVLHFNVEKACSMIIRLFILQLSILFLTPLIYLYHPAQIFQHIRSKLQ